MRKEVEIKLRQCQGLQIRTEEGATRTHSSLTMDLNGSCQHITIEGCCWTFYLLLLCCRALSAEAHGAQTTKRGRDNAHPCTRLDSTTHSSQPISVSNYIHLRFCAQPKDYDRKPVKAREKGTTTATSTRRVRFATRDYLGYTCLGTLPPQASNINNAEKIEGISHGQPCDNILISRKR